MREKLTEKKFVYEEKIYYMKKMENERRKKRVIKSENIERREESQVVQFFVCSNMLHDLRYGRLFSFCFSISISFKHKKCAAERRTQRVTGIPDEVCSDEATRDETLMVQELHTWLMSLGRRI